jgi:GNAT superfamily N-acetyltransferase
MLLGAAPSSLGLHRRTAGRSPRVLLPSTPARAQQGPTLHRLGFVWRLYDHDLPPDLGARLLNAGFSVDEDSTLVIADVQAIPDTVELPDQVRLVPVEDEAGVDELIAVHEEVFGTDHSQLRRSILAQLEQSPSVTAMVLAMVDDKAVSSARIEFLPARQFASLWGGGTLPEWRGRGIYRALVAYRARIAASRGYPYLYVNSSCESRPILERLGFKAVSSITTYSWHPSPQG